MRHTKKSHRMLALLVLVSALGIVPSAHAEYAYTGTSSADTFAANPCKIKDPRSTFSNPTYISVSWIIDGAGGNDSLTGCQIQDLIYGGAGSDRLYGGDGDDTLYAGGRPSTTCTTSCWTVSQIDETAANYMYGGWGRDNIQGSSGPDTIYGGGNADILIGGGGNDVIHAEEGGDVDTVQCGAGYDVVYWDHAWLFGPGDTIGSDCEVKVLDDSFN